MLIARPAPKKNRTSTLRSPLTLDIFDGEIAVGEMGLSRRDYIGYVALDGRRYEVERSRPEENAVWRALVALAHGKAPQKALPNPFLLKDASGAAVATALPARKGIALSHGGREYRYRRIALFNTAWALYPPEGDTQLGTVAKKAVFSSTVLLDLPIGLDKAVQVFLLWLRMQHELEAAANSTSTN